MEKAHLLLTGLVLAVALAAAEAAESLPEVLGAAVEASWLKTLETGSSDPAAADAERAAKSEHSSPNV